MGGYAQQRLTGWGVGKEGEVRDVAMQLESGMGAGGESAGSQAGWQVNQTCGARGKRRKRDGFGLEGHEYSQMEKNKRRSSTFGGREAGLG